MESQERYAQAIRVAKMYYYQDMTTEEIAREMFVSRSTISRLLTFAKQAGLIDIKVREPREQPQFLERKITETFGLRSTQVVPVSDGLGEQERLERVAQYAANYLNSLFDSTMILGIAWGTTTSAISRYLLPKNTRQSQIVQLNGAGNMQTMGVEYASEIIMRFAQNYHATPHLFPVPAFFDRAETKNALWRESSIKRILDLQNQADLWLFSIGAVSAGIPSHVYDGGYLSEADRRELAAAGIAGDIATVFFRDEGDYREIGINRRSSGPDLEVLRNKHGVCVISGPAKLRGVLAALKGQWVKDLVIDEPTARQLIEVSG